MLYLRGQTFPRVFRHPISPVLHSIPIPHRTPTKMMNHLPPMEKIQLLSFAVIPRTAQQHKLFYAGQ